MSKCMTIADETVDQKDISLDIAPKEIVEIILEEALLSALIVSDKGCSRIGDSNITDEFRQQYDQLSNQKDFEQVEPAANKDSNFRENFDRTPVPAKGNLEQIIDSFVKEEGKNKLLNDCQVISEEILADNEFQVKNGQIYIEKNNTQKATSGFTREEFFQKKDVIKDEKIEIEYFDKGQLNKIYVPLNLTCTTNNEQDSESKPEDALEKNDDESKTNEENNERPFKPFTTEDLRQSTIQVWENGNSSLVGRWDGDILTQRDEVVKIMEELSSVQVFSDNFADPNRPRACAFGEEDVIKMTKEIEDINFNQGHVNPEGQGDADLESDNPEKSQNERVNSQNYETNNQNLENDRKDDLPSTEEKIRSQTSLILPDNTAINPKEENCLEDSREDVKSFIEEKEDCMKKLNSACSIRLQPDVEDYLNVQNVEVSRTDSASLKTDCQKEFVNDLTESVKSLSEIKQNDLPSEDQDPTTDIEVNVTQEKSSSIMESESVTETQDNLSDLNQQTQQGTLSWSGLTWQTKEAVCTLNLNSFVEEKHWERIKMDYNPVNEEAEGKIESNDAENFLQEPQSQLDECKSNVGIIQNGEDANLNERLEDSLIYAEKNVENFEKLEDRICKDEKELIKADSEEESLMNGVTFDYTQTAISAQSSEKTLNENDLSNESNEGSSTASQTSQMKVNDETKRENEPSEALVGGSQKFKLHSQKMYSYPHYEPAGQVSNDFTLTESEETFIDMSENIIQVIDPPENSTDEDSNEISFSLLAEASSVKSTSRKNDIKSEFTLKDNSSENEVIAKKVYSGMTTIGPIKNADYDPKDLSAPEIDYGKMTRITSSRQLARDMGLLNSENPALSVKIIEEYDFDDDASFNLEDEHVDRNSLVNRDIASLTKVQKVREVMSHQAKPEEDFEDEESLPRPRLDLKDVESMTDERYKFPDVSIPLLSFEIGDRNLDAEKELIESMGLVISGLTNACFYEGEMEDCTEIQTNNSTYETENNTTEFPTVLDVDKHDSNTESLIGEEIISPLNEGETREELKPEEKPIEEGILKDVLDRKDSQDENSENPKYSTLSNVFRKASSKFMKKDTELRNSKSLPRDTNKISATNSIRSILDDCQSSASNMLKKSCSLLKNTESIFKSISQSMVTSDRSFGSNTTQKKLSPSESDVSTIERKFSGYFKKEDFTKAKNLIKSKVEKTFKSSDKEKSPPSEPETPSEKEDRRLAVRNEENLRIDRIENFKKLLPKSPLVYKSQFVRSQMNFQSQSEPEATVNPSVEDNRPEETVNSHPIKEINDTVSLKEKELHEETPALKIYPQENLQWIIQKEDVQLPLNENNEPQQPDFIVMETIQGLPASDLESPSSEKENLNVENTTTKENDYKKIDASNTLQIFTDSSQEVAPRLPETDEEKPTTKTPSERKLKTKKKKFTARFRSFWCSAFGRAKTPEKKGDLS